MAVGLQTALPAVSQVARRRLSPDDRCVTYREYSTVVPEVVLWRSNVA